MICFTENKNIDKKKWDACIDRSPDACIFVYSWYLDAVCDNWSALIMNDYEAVFPLAPKSKYRISYLYQPFFTRYFGVFSKKPANDIVTSAFFNAIPVKFRLIDFAIHEGIATNPEGYSQTKRKYQWLDLHSSYVDLQKGYSDNAKRNIKKAAKTNFHIETGIAPQVIIKLFKETKGEELSAFKPKNFKNLHSLMNVLVDQKKAETFAVYTSDNQLCAAAFFMKNKKRFVYLKSGVSDYGRSNGAMHFLFDFFIRKYAGTDTILDFGGSSVETVARFYKNFGAKDCVYLQLKKNALPRVVKWLSNKA